MDILLNSRTVPEGLRQVVEAVVGRFTFGTQRFRWIATPSDDVVLSMPPIIVESSLNPREEEGKLLRAGIEEEIRDTIARLLPFTESTATEAQQ
ncbi:MAG: hypothetical protein EOP83_05025 [Verrucomicrobiaceae bacterium]|nr:MAG: hypothetical protein EOP83_05025 [Verrucomicrobiaceae bacterium]